MSDKKLDWANFDWSQFQTLSLYIAENLIPDCEFEEFLKQGHKQEGIDLLSFNKKDGTFITIQCKRVKQLNKNDLIKIIDEFLVHDFSKKSSQFLLSTSADLQKPHLQKLIQEYKTQLWINNKINFDCWDISFIETHLKEYWNIVAYYFGNEIADRFCFPQLNYSTFKNILPVQNYVPRKIKSFSGNNPAENIIWHVAGKQLYDLKDFFVHNRLTTYHICLIGEAYQGKSSYLKQTAFELRETNMRIQPLLIEIKEYNVQPIEVLLNTLYGSWKNIPIKDLVLIIDGLDEVPTDKFDEVVRNIKEFSKSYPSISIVFSCRKLFYNFYNVGKILTGFDVYELYSLQLENIDYYLQNKLGTLFYQFKEAAYRMGITGLLYHPFYLVNLAEEFEKPPHRLPSNKIKVIESFIERTYISSLERRISKGQSITHESYQFKQTVQQFAFALQLLGANAFTSEEVQQLFSKDEIELLQHNALISISKNSWSFTNALFQEHLAALCMSNMNFEEIISFVAVGKGIRKIKTKWIQTLSSLVSILEIHTPLFEQLLQFIESDNIELVFETENSKYSPEFKFTVLKKLIEKCITLNVRPIIVYEEAIAIFVDGVSTVVDYLLNRLADNSIKEYIKIVCCRILKTLSLSEQQCEAYIIVAFDELTRTSNDYYAGHLIEIISANKLGDKSLVEKLVSIEKFNTSHNYRDKLYELLIILELVEDYYSYGLEGIKYLISYNREISHGGSERRLENFLLATNKLYYLSLLFKEMESAEWTEFYRFRSIRNEGFLNRLFDKCISFHKNNSLIIFPVSFYIQALSKQFLRDEFGEVNRFLEATQSNWIVVRILIKDILEDKDWEYATMITKESYDYILFEYEVKNYDIQALRTCISGLRYKNKNEIADEFFKLCNDATEGSLINHAELLAFEKYRKEEEQRRKNDLLYIQSRTAFIKGVVNYFKAYGKESIPEQDLYVDNSDRLSRKNADSYFVFEYLLDWIRSNKVVYLRNCLKHLEDEERFNEFRAEEILNYSYESEDSKQILLPILQEYYYSNLPKVKFENCMWIEDNLFKWRRKERRLGDIFLKFQFPTSESYLVQMIWLDDGGTRNFETAKLNKRNSLSQLIIEHLNPDGVNLLKKIIIQNFKVGIKLEGVLGNHVALCKHLKIYEAREPILEIIKKLHYNDLFLGDVADIYLELGGDKNELAIVLETITIYNDYFYLYLISLLSKSHSKVVEASALKALSDFNTTDERKIQIAQHLAEIGNIEGFIFLVGKVRKERKSPYHIQSGIPVHNVDTERALNELRDIMFLIVDRKYDIRNSFHDTAKSIIIEWLYGFASKSEKDLRIVTTFLKEVQSELINEYQEAIDLNWYIERMIENFRSSDENLKPIQEIKRILASLKK